MSTKKMTTGEKWLVFWCGIAAFSCLVIIGAASSANSEFAMINAPIPPTTQSASPVSTVINLAGQWTADMNNGAMMIATVKNETITVVLHDHDATMTYWYGTFDSSAKSGDDVASLKNDSTQAILSSDSMKTFTIGDDTISFDMTVMGVTKRVTLSRV